MHLVYRVPYNEPNHKFYKEFKEENIIDWFNFFWEFYSDSEDEFQENITKEIGVNIYGLWGLTRRWVEEGKDYFQVINKEPPKNHEEIVAYLNDGYCNEIEFVNKKALQVSTDDNECALAYYMFTNEFAKENPEKCSYLIYPDWELPKQYSLKNNFREQLGFEPKSTKVGENDESCTYIAIFPISGGGFSNETLKENVIKIKGIRINELNDFFKSPGSIKIGNLDLFFLRTQIKNDSLIETIVMLNSKCRTNDIEKLDKSKFQVTEHMIQASIHTDTWKTHSVYNAGKDELLFHHWIIFDDLWASENSNLANSILNFAGKWDVLK